MMVSISETVDCRFCYLQFNQNGIPVASDTDTLWLQKKPIRQCTSMQLLTQAEICGDLRHLLEVFQIGLPKMPQITAG